MIRKAVIPVAGWGTRVLPASKSVPKPMLPLADLPTIHYIVEEAVASGIEHIVLVTSRQMRAVEDYFDENPELLHVLEGKRNERMIERLRRAETMARFSFVRQPQPRGLGHAVLMAREIIGNEPFAVLLGDDVVVNDHGPTCLSQLIAVFERMGGSVIGAMRVPDEQVSRYGIIAGEPAGDRLMRVRGLVEKPPADEAPSNWAVAGRYVLTPEIFDALAVTPPGKGGEIQLTDAMAMLLSRQPLYAFEFQGERFDTGDTVGWLTTSLAFALRRPDLAPGIKAYLRTLRLDD
jgi:UTP--glucose-1-phosphate uridylyltransferase